MMCPPYEVRNCVIYSNTATDTARADLYNDGMYAYGANTSYFYCCTSSNLPTGNNITNNPRFVDAGNGNYRLAAGSACINTATNLPWMATAVDLDGRSRLDKATRIPDIGAYEYVIPITVIRSY